MSKESTEDYWTKYAAEHLLGKTVSKVRYMTDEEAKDMMWYNRPIVIEFTDGTLILPSRDDEGNDGGALFGQTKDGKGLTFPVIT
jgi:hypothetical protein